MSTVHPVDCNSSDINSVINLYILRPQYEDFLKKGFGINLWFLSHLSLFEIVTYQLIFCNIISRDVHGNMGILAEYNL